jgi:hypothetical protein
MAQVYENMLAFRQLVKGVISPPFENPPIESKLSPLEERNNDNFFGNKIPKKRKEYLKKYMKVYFENRRRKELVFTNSEYSFLQKMAKQHKQKVGVFAKNCIFSYLRKQYIVPNKDDITKLGLSIRSIGNNINQISKHTNMTKSLGLFNTKRINNQLNNLEEKVEKMVNRPEELTEVLSKAIVNNPYLIYQIELILYHEKMKRIKQ